MHVVVDISAHGYGHLAQCAALVESLRTQSRTLRFTIRSGHPEHQIRRFIDGPFDIFHAPPDPGMEMQAPDRVDVPASLRRYTALANNVAELSERDADSLSELAPDRLVSNIGIVGLLAAQRVGVPALAFCSLNWFDILQSYASTDDAAVPLAMLKEGYRAARQFIAPTPSLEMAFLGNRVRRVGPMCRRGRRDPASVRAAAGWSENTRIGMVSWGGIAHRDDFLWLPQRAGLAWLAPTPSSRPDIVDLRRLEIGFSDLLASADVLLAKPGYGLFCEAAAAGTPVVYTSRPDWPETAPLTTWLRRHVAAFEVPSFAAASSLERALEIALEAPRGDGRIGDGAPEAASLVLAH